MGSLVSLVMTDIVDSTRRWNAAEGAMAADLEMHDRLIREVVEGAGGTVFKHTGDGMIAVFDDPVAAVGAAAGIQQAIGAALWQQPDGLRVRAAVHSGVVYPRDGDMYGTAVNRLARLLGVCPPGGVLVSGATSGLLTDRAPEGVRLERVGEVALAGFTTPEEVHAVVGMGHGPVAVVESEVRRESTLPAIHDELVGRADEVAAIWDALGRAQLVTLVGVGGMGKTRLALEVAAGAVAAYDGSVWWIDLANATSNDATVAVAMAAVGAREVAGRTPLQALCDRFAGVTGLVVVDNCEHVLSAARSMVDALRTARPSVRIVSTSREALGLRGEQIVPVGSLPLGDSVELFVERAGAVRPDLDVVADREVIERICARLDGIPLAVELAAARCRSMTPADIDERLTDRFRLLRGGRDGAERHRTLQAAVAWSYSLLDDDERTVFDQLAVFAGGSLVDGVVAVTGLDEFDVLDVLDRLVARSMVVATRTPLGMRYHQLETLRQFAEDRLVEAGVIDEARARHLDWVRQLAVSIFLSGGTPRGGDGFRRFCAEVDNLRVAVAHATTIGRHSVAHEIVASLSTYAYYRPLYELLDWVRPIQLEDGWTDMAAVCAVWGVANDALRAGHTDLDLSGGVPAEVIVRSPAAWLSYAYNQILLPGGGWQAALETLASMPADGGRFGAAVDQLWLLAQYFRQLGGGPHSMLGDDEFAELRRRGGAAVELARRQGDELVYAVSLGQLALALEVRFPAEAMELAQESAAVAEQLGADAWRATVLGVYHRCNAQTVARNGADSPEAMRLLRDAIVATLDNEGALRAGVLTVAAFTYIAHADPDVAILFIARWRQASDVNVDAYLVRAGIPVPSDWGEWERRTARQSLADLTGAVLAALDRVIAAAEAASSTEGAG